MSPEEFRASAHQVVDWMADYLRDIRQIPVEAISPQVAAVRRIDELGVDPHSSRRPAHASFKQISHPKLLRQLPCIN